jgi:two-component system, NarL family, nitrate/nitrite response regulator NarL
LQRYTFSRGRTPLKMRGRRDTDVILIASHSPLLRNHWRQALKGRFAIGEATHWAGLKDRIMHLKPAVVLLDVSLPGLGQLSQIAPTVRSVPQSKIILLSRSPQDREGLSAVRFGARGYCPGMLATPLMPRIIEKVRSGEVWIGRKLVATIIEEVAALSAIQGQAVRGDFSPGESDLTFREREIARLLVKGATNKEIAIELSLSEKTVKGHMTALFRKLGVRNRLRLGLLLAQFVGSSRRGVPDGEVRKRAATQ